MSLLRSPVASGLVTLLGVSLALLPVAVPGQGTARRTLVPFRSDSELSGFLRAAVLAQRELWSASAPAPPSCGAPPVLAVDSSGAWSGAAMITGRVRAEPSVPGAAGLGDVMVTISPIGTSAATAADGTFEIRLPVESLPSARSVAVIARRIGYVGRTQSLTLRQGDRVHIEVPMCPAAVMLSAVVTGAAAAAPPSVTNTQEAGVDEGDIVKRVGDYLVMLRRGRLFTVDVGRGRLRPVAAVDAFVPGIDPDDTWYDELHVWRDRVVVVGYSYARGGTELGVFRIDRAGGLRHLGTYQLRSDDYYSSRNYASRLIGHRLIFYAPLSLDGAAPARPLAALPALRRWRPAGNAGDSGVFRPTVTTRHVFRPAGAADPATIDALHTVTTCDLAAPELTCASTVVVAPEAHVFYVSPTAVYVWAAAWRSTVGSTTAGAEPAMLVRMPLDGGAPSALRVAGSPVDQFSFLERDGHLNVLVRSNGAGEGMWRAERGRGALALLRVPLARFTDGRDAAPAGAYRPLPAAAPASPTPVTTALAAMLPLHDRFVGDRLLYGAGNGWGRPTGSRSTLFVVPVRGGEVVELPVPHGIDRIEALGRDALVVGGDSADLHFM